MVLFSFFILATPFVVGSGQPRKDAGLSFWYHPRWPLRALAPEPPRLGG